MKGAKSQCLYETVLSLRRPVSRWGSIYWWSRQYPATDAAECKISRSMVIDVYQWLKEICGWRLLNHNDLNLWPLLPDLLTWWPLPEWLWPLLLDLLTWRPLAVTSPAEATKVVIPPVMAVTSATKMATPPGTSSIVLTSLAGATKVITLPQPLWLLAFCRSYWGRNYFWLL